MAANYTNNWVYDKERVSEAGRRAAERAHKQEKELIGRGWRWISITPRTKILVPCGKNGKPTSDGKRMIEQAKASAV